MVVSPARKSCNPLTLGCRAAPTSSRSSIHLDRLDRRSLNIIRGTFDSLPAYTSQTGSRARDRSRPRSPNIAHSTAALPWLSPTPLSSNCTRIFPRPPGDFVFPCHNGPFAIGLANRLFETTEENVVCRHIRRPLQLLNDVIRYPSVFAELAQKSRQTLVAKMSSCTRLTVPPIFFILNSWFFSFCCNQNCFVHT